MNSLVKHYENLNINKKEILRYSSCKEVTPEVETMMNECLDEVLPLLKPQLCYYELDQELINKFFEYATIDSAFRQYMSGCSKAILFAATLGFGFDRLITRYEKISMAKASMLQAIGAQQVEEMCDKFCAEIKEVYPQAKPRYSPGFGGLSLDSQKLVFDVLGCQNKIGIRLNASYLMSPTKSVSAFIAIKDEI